MRSMPGRRPLTGEPAGRQGIARTDRARRDITMRRMLLGRVLGVVSLVAAALVGQGSAAGPALALDSSLSTTGTIVGIPFDRTWTGTVTPGFVDPLDIPV